MILNFSQSPPPIFLNLLTLILVTMTIVFKDNFIFPAVRTPPSMRPGAGRFDCRPFCHNTLCYMPQVRQSTASHWPTGSNHFTQAVEIQIQRSITSGSRWVRALRYRPAHHTGNDNSRFRPFIFTATFQQDPRQYRICMTKPRRCSLLVPETKILWYII